MWTFKLKTSDGQLADPVHTDKSFNCSPAVNLAVSYVYKFGLFI